ncbi:MAG: CapA family protein [Nitrospirae bacterium]|nr:CapA family protein [Nitrospirota bacterium]
MVSVVIGGDICPVGRNEPLFRSGDAPAVFNDLLPEFESADLSIVSLESPLIEDEAPIVKCGPVLGVGSDCINAIREAKIDVVNLANNHIMDHGLTGLENTLSVCSGAGISTVGAGRDLEEAGRILVRRAGGISIGILAAAEHEFSVATTGSGGANPLDLIDYVRRVRNDRDAFDYLIVLLHGGNENYPYPSPRLKKTCRFMVETGADAVIVQHTHCPGCYEEYEGAHIVYGQGNLIFDWPGQEKPFHEGFLVKLLIADDLSSSMEMIPYVQSDVHAGARRMDGESERLFFGAFMDRSRSVGDDGFVQAQWLRFCERVKHEYMSKALAHNRVLSKLNSRGAVVKHMYAVDSIACMRNVISCESHREVLETIFNHGML